MCLMGETPHSKHTFGCPTHHVNSPQIGELCAIVAPCTCMGRSLQAVTMKGREEHVGHLVLGLAQFLQQQLHVLQARVQEVGGRGRGGGGGEVHQ